MKTKVKSSKSLTGRADGTKSDRWANEGFKVPEAQQAVSRQSAGSQQAAAKSRGSVPVVFGLELLK